MHCANYYLISIQIDYSNMYTIFKIFKICATDFVKYLHFDTVLIVMILKIQSRVSE